MKLTKEARFSQSAKNGLLLYLPQIRNGIFQRSFRLIRRKILQAEIACVTLTQDLSRKILILDFAMHRFVSTRDTRKMIMRNGRPRSLDRCKQISCHDLFMVDIKKQLDRGAVYLSN